MSEGKEKAILAINCGSSSLKLGLYLSSPKGMTLLCEGEAEEIGRESSSFWLKSSGDKTTDKIDLSDHATALKHMLEALRKRRGVEPYAIGHRFVHGGPLVREHQRITNEVAEQLRAAVPFAPLHLPAALTVMESIEKEFPGVPQVVCLDTAFHRTLPDVAKTFALPDEARKHGVERYGFHGISVESILAQLNPVPERMVVAHLGNGSSITAIRDGISIDTSMGLTPTGGVMMGTRCGDIDPGVLIYLARHGYANPEQLENICDHRSGLLGVSGKSSDVRELSSIRKTDKQADLALRMFCYQVKKTIGGMSAALGGLDLLIFTGGIGEHAAELREAIGSGLECLGRFEIRVLPAEEDLQIARITAKLVGADRAR